MTVIKSSRVKAAGNPVADDFLEKAVAVGDVQQLKKRISKKACKGALAVIKKVVNRYEQISSISFEAVPMSQQERLRLAFFIETNIHKVKPKENRFFEKGFAGICRALIVDAMSRDVFLLADPDGSSLKGGGTFKELRGAVLLPHTSFKKNPEVVAHLFTKIDRNELSRMKGAKLKKEIKELQELHEETEKEVAYYRRFRTLAGMAMLYSSVRYNEVIQGENVPRISMLFRLATGDLQKRIDAKVVYTLQEEWNIATQLTRFFAALHKAGTIHADIKPENILLYEGDAIGVTDFGLAFNEKKKGERAPTYMFKLGYYGTEKYTAPELFGNLEFSKTGDFTKADVWALGCLLYELHFKKPSPGRCLLESHDRENFDNDRLRFKDAAVLEKAQKAFQEEVLAGPEKKLAALAAKRKALTPKEQYERYIYRMLRLDPVKRVTMAGAIA